MWSIPNEDEYWERRREEYERVPKDWKPEPERQILSLDDELDDLEKEYGCKLEDLNEPDIEEIVFRIRGEYPMSAEYDPSIYSNILQSGSGLEVQHMVEKKVIKRRHKDILNFCKRYMSEKGFPPSVREIGDGIGLKSTSSTCHYMQEMREMGLIISGPEFSPRAFTLPGAKYVFEDDQEGGSEA